MYSSKEDIKCDDIEMNNHNDFVKALSTTIEKYVNRHVEERVSKYEDYDKIIELIHGLPIIEKKQRKIEKLKKKIRKLKKIIDENSENIKLVIEEKKEIIDLTNDISDDEKEEIKVVKIKEEDEEEEEEDKNSFECDDCNKKGGDCFEEIGISKDEYIIYIDLGEPDRCEDCFNKWKESDNASEYIDKLNNEEEAEEEEAEEEEAEEEEEEEEEVEEEEVEEAEEEEEEVEEAEEEEEVEEEEVEEEEEEEEEVFEIEIDDITYYTSDIENGKLYKNDDGEVGDEVGHLKDGEAYFDNE